MEDQKLLITWEEFVHDIKELAAKIDRSKITKIVAITKGGLIPAYYLAKLLGIQYTETLCISSYDKDDKKQKPAVVPFSKEPDFRKGWLIVDDLQDSGDTMKLAKSYFPNAQTACLYIKPSASFRSDYFVDYSLKIIGHEWVVFPWEINL